MQRLISFRGKYNDAVRWNCDACGMCKAMHGWTAGEHLSVVARSLMVGRSFEEIAIEDFTPGSRYGKTDFVVEKILFAKRPDNHNVVGPVQPSMKSDRAA